MIAGVGVTYGNVRTAQDIRSDIQYVLNGHQMSEDKCIELIDAFVEICSKSAGVKFSLQAVKEPVDVPNVNIRLIRELLANRRNKHMQLPDDVVIGIKRMYASGMSKYTIAKELGISRNTVNGYLK